MPFNEQWIAFNTILIKEFRRFTRIWIQTLLPPAITMALYFVIFGHLIGSQIGEMSGFSYSEFVAPGLIMMAVITNAYANVSSSFFSAKFQRSIDEVLVSPTPNYIIVLGYVMGGVARGLAVGLIVTLLALMFTKLSISHGFITFSVIFLTASLFSLAGFINAVYAKSFDDISIIPTFVLTPLTYLGGVFYSINLLPDFWQAVSLANPILHMVNAFRFGILGVTDTSLMIAFVSLFAGVGILFWVSLIVVEEAKGLRS
jgi:ABC-2 type transport system permease protein